MAGARSWPTPTWCCSPRRWDRCPRCLPRWRPRLGAHTVVTDAGSTKRDVIAAARAAMGAALPRFVPGHPIAGTEHSGAAPPSRALFRDKQVVLTPLAETDPDALARVSACWTQCGAVVRHLDPLRHDAIFAAVATCRMRWCSRSWPSLPRARTPTNASALPAAGCATSPAWRAGRRKCGATCASPTAMCCASELDAYRQALDRVDALLAAADGDALLRLFERARQRARRLARAHAAAATKSSRLRDLRLAVAKDHLDLAPVVRMAGTLRLPGSKSISNRTLLLCALARGDTEVAGLLDADDVDGHAHRAARAGHRHRASPRHARFLRSRRRRRISGQARGALSR